jgi:putative membrane protein
MKYFVYLLKGIAVGVANIIPGVSGGTIALITGIFERLINAIKSFNIASAKLFFKGEFKKFAMKTDLYFLLSLFAGVILAIVLLARLFDFLFHAYPVYIWSYFFGLVLASVYFVGKTIQKVSSSVVLIFIIGTAIAMALSFINPASENSNFFYLIICGVVAVCSMILPGLSGSFVLILMGNYQLVAIQAINTRDVGILLPVLIGAVGGLIAFSHVLSWVFKKYKNQTIAILTGFILGSLNVLWPWKNSVYLKDDLGNDVIKHGEHVIAGYVSVIPDTINTEVLFAVVFMIVGIISISVIELTASKSNK